jgi:transposase
MRSNLRDRNTFSQIAPTGARPDRTLPPRSTVNFYFCRWQHDGTLDRLHHALYVRCREQADRAASPTAAIIDSQSVKSAEKGGGGSIRRASMAAKRSRARSGMFLSTRRAC